MNTTDEFKLRNKVAENVLNNINVINDLLKTSPSTDIITKSEELLELCKSNSQDHTSNQPSDEYFNLATIDKLAKLTEIEKLSYDDKDSKKRNRNISSSRTSLSSFSSIEDFQSVPQDELLTDIQSSIDSMKLHLFNISLRPLTVDFLADMKAKELAKKKKVIAFVVDLNRLQKEIEKIASSDNFNLSSVKKSHDDADDFEIDETTIDDLRTLNKVKSLRTFYFIAINVFFSYQSRVHLPKQQLTNMRLLQTRPAEEQEKPELANFTASSHIDRLLEMLWEFSRRTSTVN